LAGGVQAQSAAPALSSLPDFTGIVQKNAPAVVHVEAKYNGKKTTKGRTAQRGGMPGGGMPIPPTTTIPRWKCSAASSACR
jgi:serine protease Do